jgi:regulator of cell morphogenesis and NO signaling
LEHPSSPAVLESLGVDYCCGGDLPFEEACAKAGHSAEAVLQNLQQAASAFEARQQTSTDWKVQPLADLIDHITRSHHAYLRAASPRLLELANKVASKHGPNHPALLQVEETLAALAEELSVHLLKEEQILFPYVTRLEESALQREPAPPSACFGSIENPIRMMMSEHDSAGEALRELRRLTDNYAIPADACMSYRAFFQGLIELEADLHQHIHLENNILFPRAIELTRGK